jgi:hypothetical protein
VIVPGPTINDNPKQTPAGANPELSGNASPAGLGFCYTYSDMTGQQLALATDKPGYYRQVFPGCPSGNTSWFDLAWDANTPAGTKVVFVGRTAATKDALATAPWITLATAPPQTSPISLKTAFGKTPLQSFLEIEVRLFGLVTTAGLVGPTVSKFSVTKSCDVQAK